MCAGSTTCFEKGILAVPFLVLLITGPALSIPDTHLAMGPEDAPCICNSSSNQVPKGALTLRVQASRKKMHKRSTPEEYVELAEICLLEADLALDHEGAERLRIMARRYLEEAERILRESEQPCTTDVQPNWRERKR
jgi:hypothetical protein